MSAQEPPPPPPGSDPAVAAPRSPRSSRRRRWKIAAWIVLPLLILGLIVFVLPTYAARYILRDQLNTLGIASEGIDTLKIDIWNREVWLGPVLFHGEGAPFGEVEEVGLKFGVVNLIHRQALVRTLIIKGVDIQVTREMDGNIIVNGIALNRLTQPREEPPPPPPPEEDAPGWGAGLDDFRFVESRIFFSDRARGTIEVNVDNLELYDFRTWQPDHPGRFVLDARINNMGFRAQGTARPFGDLVRADVDLTVDEVELEKISRYTGPLGFERHAGVLQASIQGTLEAGRGAVDATAKGAVTITDADANRPEQFAAALDRAVLNLDNRYRLAPGGASTISGPLKLVVDAARLNIAGGSRVQFDKGTIAVPALTAEQADGRTQAATNVEIVLDGVEAQPAGEDGRPSPSIAAGTIVTDLKDIKATLAGDATQLTGTLDLALGAVKARLPQPTSGDAQQVDADEVTLSLTELAVRTGSDGTNLSASGATSVTALSAAMPAADGKPPVDAAIESLNVNLSEIAVQLGSELLWSAALDAVVDAITASVAGGDLANATIGQLNIKGVRADQALAIGADDVRLGGVDIAVKRDVMTAFAGQPQAGPAEDAAPQAAEESSEEGGGAKPSLRLGSFALSSPAKIDFTDTTVSPEVRLNTSVKTLQVDDLDMAKPAQKTDVRLAVVVNDFTNIDASGWVAPFGAKPNFDILAQIEKLELPHLSPYAAQAVGANIDSGRLGLKADTMADAGKLDGRLMIDIYNLAFGALSKEDAERLSASIGVPIGTVVGLLQDSEGKISLNIPISGDLTSPSFDLSNTIGQALTGAVAGAVTAPFKLLFEPVGALATAVGGGGPSFKPIPFEAGAATLTPEAQTFTSNLAKMLKERPKLSLRVCGKTSNEDLQALRARGELPQAATTPPTQGRAAQTPAVDDQARSALTRLAEERTRVIRQQLVDRDKIGANQVAECRAAFEPDKKEGPRVEISF